MHFFLRETHAQLFHENRKSSKIKEN